MRAAIAHFWSQVESSIARSLPWRTIECLDNHSGIELAGNLAFTAISSLFPFLIFLVALAGFIGDADAATRVINWMFGFMPKDVASALAPVVTQVLSRPRGGLLTFGIIGTLWVASSGFEALRTVLNRAYWARETRPFWLRRLQSIVFVLAGAAIMIVVSALIIVGGLISNFVGDLPIFPNLTGDVWTLIRYGVGAVMLGVGLFGLHHWLPNCNLPARRLLPGTVLTTVLWVLLASVFSLYIDNFANYDVTYGSLGGVLIALFFFYLTAIIFIAGAEFNAVLISRAQQKRTD